MFRRLFRRPDGASRSPLHLAQRQVMTVRGNRALPSLAQWRELPRYLSPGERRIFAVALAGVVLALGILGYRFFAANQTAVAAIGGEYTEGLLGTPQYLNPLYAVASDTDTDITSLVFSGLMRWDPQDGLVPDLASTYTISEDQKTYTFTLRDNATWHDGSPVTAQDVVFTMQAIQNPEYHSPLAVSLGGAGVEAPDEKSVIFTLSEPFAPFLSTLTVGILPSHVWENIAPSSAPLAMLNLEPIGSGPYKYEKLSKYQNGTIRSLSLVRNKDFYRGAPYIERISFNFYQDATELMNALRNKNVQGASYITYEDAQTLTDDRALQVLYPALPQITAAFLNDSHAKLLSDSKVRKALNLATNKDALVADVLGGQGRVISSPILPGMPGYDASVGATTYDEAGAIALLESAGYTLSEGSAVRTKGGTALALTLTTVDTPELNAVAAKLKEMWTKVGVEVTIVTVDQQTLQNDTLKNRNYDVLLTGELYGADGDPYAFWHSSQVTYPGLNLAQFTSRKVDDAIESARGTSDAAIRATSYATVASVIAEEFPAVFLYQPTYAYVTTSKIKGIALPAITIPADRFADVTEWYIRTRNVFSRKEMPAVEEMPVADDAAATTETPAATETATETPATTE